MGETESHVPPFTIGDLLDFIEKQSIPRDAEIYVEREDDDSRAGRTWHDRCPGVTVEKSSSGFECLVVHINT